jgi:hypothetical protein
MGSWALYNPAGLVVFQASPVMRTEKLRSCLVRVNAASQKPWNCSCCDHKGGCWRWTCHHAAFPCQGDMQLCQGYIEPGTPFLIHSKQQTRKQQHNAAGMWVQGSHAAAAGVQPQSEFITQAHQKPSGLQTENLGCQEDIHARVSHCHHDGTKAHRHLRNSSTMTNLTQHVIISRAASILRDT